MIQSLRNGALALAVLSAGALLAGPAIAADFSEEGDFGGTYRYIGPGASYGPPPAYVEVAPVYPAPLYAPPVYAGPAFAEPEIVAVPPPVVEGYDGAYLPDAGYDEGPDAGVTFIAPGGPLAIGRY